MILQNSGLNPTTRRASHNLAFLTALVVAARVVSAQSGAAVANQGDTPRAGFGETIIAIDLILPEAGRQALSDTPEADVPGGLRVADVDGTATIHDVVVHIKGQKGSRRPLESKAAFKVKFKNEEGFHGLDQLTLNNMVQDRTMMHEALGYQVYSAAGVAVPSTGYARVSVNRQPYGLYLNLETIDRQFLQRRFGDASGILYEGNYGVDLREADVEKFELHEGVDPQRAQLKALIRAVDAPGDDVFYGPAPQVDTPSFLGMIAAVALLDDWDNYYRSNNYRIYWHPTLGRWFFIPTGIDQTFVSQPTEVFGATGPLFQKCLASERCTQAYAHTVRRVADLFEALDLPARFDALLSMIDRPSREAPTTTFAAVRMTAAREAMRTFISVVRPRCVRPFRASMKKGAKSPPVHVGGSS